MLHACNMKLYWRIKIDGKWTYTPALVVSEDEHTAEVLKDAFSTFVIEEE